MQELHGILADEQKKDDVLRAMVLGSKGTRYNRIARPDPDRIWTLSAIKSTCLRQRARFLDGAAFKGSLPPRAVYELRRLDARSPDALRGFKLVAPIGVDGNARAPRSGALFLPLGPQHFYLVHAWGGVLSPVRAVAAWPLRGWPELLLTVVLIGGLVSLVMPNMAIGSTASVWWGPHRFMAALWCIMVLASATAFTWLTWRFSFSRDVWAEDAARSAVTA